MFETGCLFETGRLFTFGTSREGAYSRQGAYLLLVPQGRALIRDRVLIYFWYLKEGHLFKTGCLFTFGTSREGGLGSSTGRGHCVVFLGKTLYSHSVSLHPGV